MSIGTDPARYSVAQARLVPAKAVALRGRLSRRPTSSSAAQPRTVRAGALCTCRPAGGPGLVRGSVCNRRARAHKAYKVTMRQRHTLPASEPQPGTSVVTSRDHAAACDRFQVRVEQPDCSTGTAWGAPPNLGQRNRVRGFNQIPSSSSMISAQPDTRSPTSNTSRVRSIPAPPRIDYLDDVPGARSQATHSTGTTASTSTRSSPLAPMRSVLPSRGARDGG
jgi:hypothetical protein